MLPGLQLRCLLLYADVWDPSEHALLSRKHFGMCLRGEPPPQSLLPPAPGALVSQGMFAADGLTMRELNQRLALAVEGLRCAAGGAPLPDPGAWQKWHRNVVLVERKSGASPAMRNC